MSIPTMAVSSEPSAGPQRVRRTRLWIALLVVLGGAAGAGILFRTGPGRHAQFFIGGGLVNLGYRMQDHLESYDFKHTEDITPEDVWQETLEQNRLASSVRSLFPRTARHPLVVVVVCMDARIDTNELTGDTRKYYYVIRTAGSVLSVREEEMLELAVVNGVKLIIWTTHTDCAAEAAASTEAGRGRYPALAKAVDERASRVAEFLARKVIASRIAEGKLEVRQVNIDTNNEMMLPR